MIKANELRIGNLVYGFKTVWEIDSQDFKMFDVDENTLPYDFIPLTQEWALKLGLIPQKMNGVIPTHYHVPFFCNSGDFYVKIHPNPNSGIGTTNHAYWHGHFIANCDFIHELQNIVFDISGNMLTLIKDE